MISGGLMRDRLKLQFPLNWWLFFCFLLIFFLLYLCVIMLRSKVLTILKKKLLVCTVAHLSTKMERFSNIYYKWCKLLKYFNPKTCSGPITAKNKIKISRVQSEAPPSSQISSDKRLRLFVSRCMHLQTEWDCISGKLN